MRQREGNRYFCFRLRPLKLITGWVLSVPYKVPLLQEFAHDTVSDGGEGIQINVSESPGETQAKPLPQVIRVPLCYERVTGSHHQTGGLG